MQGRQKSGGRRARSSGRARTSLEEDSEEQTKKSLLDEKQSAGCRGSLVVGARERER
jgi:hypothetical protein